MLKTFPGEVSRRKTARCKWELLYHNIIGELHVGICLLISDPSLHVISQNGVQNGVVLFKLSWLFTNFPIILKIFAVSTLINMYSNVDIKALKRTADASLLNYGTAFHPEMITRAEGLYIYESNGHRMLDWTSGQMSCLIGHGNPEVVDHYSTC